MPEKITLTLDAVLRVLSTKPLALNPRLLDVLNGLKLGFRTMHETKQQPTKHLFWKLSCVSWYLRATVSRNASSDNAVAQSQRCRCIPIGFASIDWRLHCELKGLGDWSEVKL